MFVYAPHLLGKHTNGFRIFPVVVHVSNAKDNKDGPSVWTSATQVDNQTEVPGYWLTIPVSSIVTSWKVNLHMGSLFLSRFRSLSLWYTHRICINLSNK